MHQSRFANGVIRGIQHRKQFHQLGRLQIEQAKRQPALAAVDFPPYARDQHKHQQHHTQAKKIGCSLFPDSQRELEADETGHQSDEQEHALPDEVVGGLIAGEAPAFRYRDRRGVDHDQSEREEKSGDADDRVVDLRDRCRSGERPDAEKAVHWPSSSARTSSMKTSARCS